MSVQEWLEQAGVDPQMRERLAQLFPEEMQSSADQPWAVEWSEGVDEFRFTLQDWVSALLVLEEELRASQANHYPIRRKIGYLHCAAMFGEQEITETLPAIAREMYRKYGIEEE